MKACFCVRCILVGASSLVHTNSSVCLQTPRNLSRCLQPSAVERICLLQEMTFRSGKWLLLIFVAFRRCSAQHSCSPAPQEDSQGEGCIWVSQPGVLSLPPHTTYMTQMSHPNAMKLPRLVPFLLEMKRINFETRISGTSACLLLRALQ